MKNRCNSEELVKGLLDEQLFPNASNNPIQTPKIFSSRGLADFAEKNKHLFHIKKVNNGIGAYGYVRFRAYRFDNAERLFAVPHPQGYCSLVFALADEWDNEVLKTLTSQKSSLFIPSKHADGRVFVMRYGGQKRLRDRGQVLGRLEVRADVKNCFGSIYTHEIERIMEKYGNVELGKKLDKLTSYLKKKETNGILVGPGALNIVAELILSYVDIQTCNAYETRFQEILGVPPNGGLNIQRAVDDYTFYCDNFDEAEFIVDTLNEKLRLSGLELNHKKTKILPVPTGKSESWMHDIFVACRIIENVDDLSRACDKLLQIAEAFPNASVLNYGFRILAGLVFKRPMTVKQVMMISILELNLMKIAKSYPAHIALLDIIYEKQIFPKSNQNERAAFLNDMFQTGFRRTNSGTITWALYLAAKIGIGIETNENHWSRLLELSDGVTLTMIYYNLAIHPHGSAKFTRYVKRELKKRDILNLDDVWILHYQLFFEGSISESELNEFKLTHSTSTRKLTLDFWKSMKRERLSFVKVHLKNSKRERRLIPL